MFDLLSDSNCTKQYSNCTKHALHGNQLCVVGLACFHDLNKVYHTIPYHTIPYHTIPYHTIPYHTIPYHTIPYHTIPYHTIPYHTIPYHTIPYHTIPYHTIPYHTIPYTKNSKTPSISEFGTRMKKNFLCLQSCIELFFESLKSILY